MQNIQQIELCSNLLSTEFHAQLIHPELERAIGEKPARFLSQLLYWLNKCGQEKEGRIWMYNTVQEWKENFVSYSEKTIRKHFKTLELLGLVVSQKLDSKKWNQRKWYSINFDKLSELLIDIKSTKQPVKPHLSASGTNYQIKLGISTDSYTNNNITNNNNNLSCENEKEEVQNHAVEIEISEIRQKEEKRISKDMIDVWNEIIPNEKVYGSERRTKKLLGLWSDQLDCDIEKWRDFCFKVNSSQFLMGEKKKGFKAHFDWIIEENVAMRVLNNDFGVGDRVPDLKREEAEQKKQELLNTMHLKRAEQRQKMFQEEEKLKNELEEERRLMAELEVLEQTFTEDQKQDLRRQFEEHMASQAESDEDSIQRDIARQFLETPWKNFGCTWYFDLFKIDLLLKKKRIQCVDGYR